MPVHYLLHTIKDHVCSSQFQFFTVCQCQCTSKKACVHWHWTLKKKGKPHLAMSMHKTNCELTFDSCIFMFFSTQKHQKHTWQCQCACELTLTGGGSPMIRPLNWHWTPLYIVLNRPGWSFFLVPAHAQCQFTKVTPHIWPYFSNLRLKRGLDGQNGPIETFGKSQINY